MACPLDAIDVATGCLTGRTFVQVFILMGQSNMLGEGKKTGAGNSLETAVKTDHKYPYLWDAAKGDWSVSDTVRNVFVMGSEPASEGAEGGSLLGVAVVGLSLMVVLLLVMLTLAVLHIREDSDWGEDEPEDEIEEESVESS